MYSYQLQWLLNSVYFFDNRITELQDGVRVSIWRITDGEMYLCFWTYRSVWYTLCGNNVGGAVVLQSVSSLINI